MPTVDQCGTHIRSVVMVERSAIPYASERLTLTKVTMKTTIVNRVNNAFVKNVTQYSNSFTSSERSMDKLGQIKGNKLLPTSSKKSGKKS